MGGRICDFCSVVNAAIAAADDRLSRTSLTHRIGSSGMKCPNHLCNASSAISLEVGFGPSSSIVCKSTSMMIAEGSSFSFSFLKRWIAWENVIHWQSLIPILFRILCHAFRTKCCSAIIIGRGQHCARSRKLYCLPKV